MKITAKGVTPPMIILFSFRTNRILGCAFCLTSYVEASRTDVDAQIRICLPDAIIPFAVVPCVSHEAVGVAVLEADITPVHVCREDETLAAFFLIYIYKYFWVAWTVRQVTLQRREPCRRVSWSSHSRERCPRPTNACPPTARPRLPPHTHALTGLLCPRDFSKHLPQGRFPSPLREQGVFTPNTTTLRVCWFGLRLQTNRADQEYVAQLWGGVEWRSYICIRL